MKKELTILGFAMAPLAMAPNAMAAGTAIAGTTTLTAAACTLLQDDLRIQVSNNVVGGYTCDTATNNAIYLATCHTSGRVATRTSPTVVNPTTCAATPSDTAACATTTSSASGAVIPVASTLGGSMVMKFPGGTCDTAGSKAASQLP